MVILNAISTILGVFVPPFAAFSGALMVMYAHPRGTVHQKLASRIAGFGAFGVAVGGMTATIVLTWAHTWWLGMLVVLASLLAGLLLAPLTDWLVLLLRPREEKASNRDDDETDGRPGDVDAAA